MRREYPDRPIVGVGAIIIRGEEVLLARRGKEPAYGEWSIPGGVVELGERLEDAVKREVREEVNLTVRVEEVVALCAGGFPLRVSFGKRETVERCPGGSMGSHFGNPRRAPSKADERGHSKGL